MELTGPEGASEQAQYVHLAQRAAEFLRARGGVAAEDALVQHIFGAAGPVDLWRPLLRRLLANAESVLQRADGCWTLTAVNLPESGENLLGDFVSLDLETTGLKPSRQRIIEIAVIRFSGGREIERFESLVNPGRKLPKYIAELTRLNDEMLSEAPAFAEIVGQALELIGDSLIVGHNVGFDIGFMQAELQRLNLPVLVNERLDTMSLALRLLPGIRKPGLDQVAGRLGVPARVGKIHRAGTDASITAEVALRLEHLARQNGYDSEDALRALSRSLPARPKRHHARATSILDRSLMAHVPALPGVYLMRNRNDEIVYVGKAKNLRSRVSSYFSQHLGYTRKMDGLLESLATIDVEVAGSELEALLLESQLIRRYQPRYNTALRSHEQYPFIRLDIANPWPRLTLAKARKDDGARYFGPFRSPSAARRTVDLINRVVPLRTCSRSFRDARSYGSPCLELDLGRCLGPCVGKADREQYRQWVHQTASFLDGRDEVLYEILWAALEDAAEQLDFERAAKLRAELRQAITVVSAQRRLREVVEQATCLLVLPAAGESERLVMTVAGGRSWSQLIVRPGDPESETGARLARSWSRLNASGAARVDHDSVDETHILHRWLSRHRGYPGWINLDEHPPWDEIARQIHELSLDELRALEFSGALEEANDVAVAEDEPEAGEQDVAVA